MSQSRTALVEALERSPWVEHGLEQGGDERERAEFLAAVAGRNPGRAQGDERRMLAWDLAEYERPHLPVVVGELAERAAFSRAAGLRILDMAIKAPGRAWVLPRAIEQFREVLELAVRYERAINPDFEAHYYAYVTVDQKRVEPGAAQRRIGWHGDAFVSPATTRLDAGTVWVDNTYVVFDALSTLFLPGPFSLRGIDASDIRAVLARFEELARGAEPRRFPAYTLLRMTPYDVHTPDVHTGSATLARTFVKIQFSRDRLNMLGNTLNRVERSDGGPAFSYDGWTWIPRDPERRNNRNHILDWDRPDRELFLEVDVALVDFDAPSSPQIWTEREFFFGRKVEGVRAEPAVPDERLETVGELGGFRSSFNIAQEGDWKITTSQGDQYFLSDARVRERYEPPAARASCFLQPRGAPARMLRVTRPVRYRSPWGAWAYAPAGSVLTRLGPRDVYAILPRNFAASYVTCDAAGHVLVAGGRRLSDVRTVGTSALIRVRDEPIELGGRCLAAFDLHGTLSRPNWKLALAGVHRRLAPEVSTQEAERWVERSTYGRSDAEVMLALAGIGCGTTLTEVERLFQEERRVVGRSAPLSAAQGVHEFLGELQARGIELYILTFAHTPRARTLAQIAEAGLAPFFTPEHIWTADSLPVATERAAFREDGLARLAAHAPGARLLFFNDTADGLAWTRAAGGISLGVPQGEGLDWDRRAAPLVAAGAHLLVRDWAGAARELWPG